MNTTPDGPDRDDGGVPRRGDEPVVPEGRDADRRSRDGAERADSGTVGSASAGPDDAPLRPEAADPVRDPTPLTQQIGRAAIVVLAILFGVFAVANSHTVDFSWVFGETRVRDDPAGAGEVGGVPLIVLLLITFVIGALMGALIEWYVLRSRRARRAARHDG